MLQKLGQKHLDERPESKRCILTTPIFNSLEYAKRLEQAGFTREQAEVQAFEKMLYVLARNLKVEIFHPYRFVLLFRASTSTDEVYTKLSSGESKPFFKEGLHVTLDPLGKKIPSDLLEHVDYICPP